MAAPPLYVETEEEIPEVIERLRRIPAEDVPLVLPSRSRMGQSRFNFQLLNHYGQQMGKRISIISADPAVQQMAEESGFTAYRAIDQYGLVTEEAVTAPAPPPSHGRGSRAQNGVLRVAAQAHARLPSKMMTRSRPGRLIIYLGLVMIFLACSAFAILYIPSATVTLTAQAKPFSQASEVAAEPGKAPVRVRAVPIQKQASSSFKTTGQKITPGAVASGVAVYHNNCPYPVLMVVGQSLNTASGLEFRQSGGTDSFGGLSGVFLAPHTARSANIVAATVGSKYNVGAGEITGIPGSGEVPCVTVDNPGPIGGGSDEVKQPQLSQADFDTARTALTQQLQKDITDELAKQAQQGEKMSELVQFDPPDFHTDHNPNDLVTGFGATMTLKGEAAYYIPDDVTRAFGDNLAKKVPAGQVLTEGAVKSDYRLDNASPGGHLLFKGTASSFIAPKLDIAKIESRIVGRSTAAAKNELEKEPVQKVDIKQSPVRMPIMPLLSSRITIRYVVDPASAPAPAPAPAPKPT